jgi:hypothetical protein
MFGKPAAERLIQALGARKDGSKRLEQAATAMASGATAIEALKQAFGKDFLSTVNEVVGTSKAAFTYEAGTQHYIRQEAAGLPPAQVLRDELNINLDRLTLLEVKGKDLKSQALGVVAVWGKRCLDLYDDTHKADIASTLKAMNDLLTGDSRNYRQIYELLSTTGLGGVGALLVIKGVLIATGTGLGLISWIGAALGGIPMMTVGAFVLPGVLLVVMAAKKARPVDDVSLSVALAYKLLERLEKR